MRSLILAVLCCALPFAAQAQSFLSLNRLVVVPLNPTDFEVIEGRGEGPRGMWCAAANFASARLGVKNAQRIYIKTPRGPSVSGAGRWGVVFTTNANAVTPIQSYSLTMRRAGANLPQFHAFQFCDDYLIEFRDRF